jgi:SAM-dependent methyltransferase
MFSSLIKRNSQATGWHKIPWHDPDFSRRMLTEHLNQAHDLASRRFRIIEQQVQWIHRKCLERQSARILDLGCGPGFYASRLNTMGHICTGIDISPASIEYAREHDPDGQYILGDVRYINYGEDYDLILMIYGELNAFSPEECEYIVGKAFASLKPAGKLLLEVSSYEAIYRSGHEAPSWHTTEKGLFADEPYLCLTESSYDLDRAVEDYYVYLTESDKMEHYITMHQGYTEDEYRRLLTEFNRVQIFPSLTGSVDTDKLFVVIGEK